MDSKRIETLLDRYWSCVSTLEEEEELKKFFNSDEVPERFKEYENLFKYFEAEKKSSGLGDSFDRELAQRIRLLKPSNSSGKIFFNYLKVAAVIAMVLVASFLFRQNLAPENRPDLMGTYEDPQEAYEETKRVLMLVASKLNKGRKYTETIGAFNEAEEKIKGGEDETDNNENKDIQL
ncbi:MAG TPA: hypothetical protein VGA21_03670 [Cyclobacteriaceae bacterium]|jgi:hypothetical protein